MNSADVVSKRSCVYVEGAVNKVADEVENEVENEVEDKVADEVGNEFVLYILAGFTK